MATNPPWPPTMDAEAAEYGAQLEAEKYNGHVDDGGLAPLGLGMAEQARDD